MELCDFTTYLHGRSESVYLKPIGDSHVGPSACAYEQLQEDIAWVRRHPEARWIGMGDLMDSISHTDKRWDVRIISPMFREREDDIFNAEKDYLVKIFKPIAHQCIGLIEGNHERKVRTTHQHDVHGGLCLGLGVRNLGQTAIIRWRITRDRIASKVVTIWASHGRPTGKKTGGPLNQLTDMSNNYEADIYLAGHCHKKIYEERIILKVRGEHGQPRVVGYKRLYAFTGTYLKTSVAGQSSYAEEAWCPPTPSGSLTFRIDPFKQTKIDGDVHDLPPQISVD